MSGRLRCFQPQNFLIDERGLIMQRVTVKLVAHEKENGPHWNLQPPRIAESAESAQQDTRNSRRRPRTKRRDSASNSFLWPYGAAEPDIANPAAGHLRQSQQARPVWARESYFPSFTADKCAPAHPHRINVGQYPQHFLFECARVRLTGCGAACHAENLFL